MEKFTTKKKKLKSKLDETNTTMNNRVIPLENNVKGYLEKLQSCVRNLSTLKPEMFWEVKLKESKKKGYVDKINIEILELRKYIETYNKISHDKIKNPANDANNLPFSIVSVISDFSSSLEKTMKTANTEMDKYAKSQVTNYNEFLLFYEKFNDNTDDDFISTIEHEYLTNDYNKKVKLLLTDINKPDNAVRNIGAIFEKKCEEYDNKLKIKCNSLIIELNTLAEKTNILQASNMYVEYNKKQIPQELPIKMLNPKKRCTIS